MLVVRLITLYLLQIAALIIYWAACLRTRNGSRFTLTALLLCGATCFYIMGYAMELNAVTPAQILFWNQVEYIGIPYVSALWLTTALLYTGHFARHRALLLVAIFLIPLCSMALRMTNHLHWFYFSSVGFVEQFDTLLLVKGAGPWKIVQTIHSMTMIFISMYLFVRDALKSGERQHGKIILIIAASIIAAVGLTLSLVQPLGVALDYMALSLPATALLVVVAIARFDLMETRSVARSRAFELSKEAMLLTNSQLRVLDYNVSAKALFDRLGAPLLNRPLSELLAGRPTLLAALSEPAPSIVSLRFGSEVRAYEVTTSAIEDRRAAHGLIKTIRDITELRRLNEELKKQAITDELSMLNNRRAFLQIGRERVFAAEQSQEPLFLAMLDIDFFKLVNDQFGHPAGDSVIREFGLLLRKQYRFDTLVARLGGEEFAILHTGGTADEMLRTLQAMMERIRRRVFFYNGHPIQITVSIGVTEKTPMQTLENLLRNADQALYRAKLEGRDQICVSWIDGLS